MLQMQPWKEKKERKGGKKDIHTMEYYSAIKKRNNAIYSNMDITRDYHAK